MLARQAELKKVRNKQFFRHLEDGTEGGKPSEVFEQENPNADVLAPVLQEERSQRKRQLEEQLFGQKESKVLRAKKKRMEKYIEHQLKREEKQVLLAKLKDTAVDTSKFKLSKTLGTGRQTRREEIADAMELERQGRGSEATREILYEEHTVKEWDEGLGGAVLGVVAEEEPVVSSFIDHRQSATGFGFKNLPQVQKHKNPKAYSWRSRVAMEESKKRLLDDDYESSEEEAAVDELESGLESELESELEEAPAEDASAEESGSFNGFSDTNVDPGAESSAESGESDGDSDSDSESSAPSDTPTPSNRIPRTDRATSFMEWAEKQVRDLEGRVEMVNPDIESLPEQYRNHKPAYHAEDHEVSDSEQFIPIDETMSRKAYFVEVERPPEVQQLRLQLPVYAEEHRIMEAIHHHDCIVLSGATGSGKTTQVPQFLYESGYGSSPDTPGMIGITQPRRVAAVLMSQRVATELGSHGHVVGHQIRFDTTTSSDTRLKFMTDGVLLREMMTDFMLAKYLAVVIDEAHERNINTDILIGMLSRVVRLRQKYNLQDPSKYKRLKVIIMSATLRVADFTENTVLFPLPPPVLLVEARQFPVSVHFNRRTAFEYVEEVVRKTTKIHQRLPPGGILIFLTGQQEIRTVVDRLRKQFPVAGKKQESPAVLVKVDGEYAEVEDMEFGVGGGIEAAAEEDDYEESGSEGEEDGFEEEREEHQTDRDPLWVLPLYSLLPTHEQMKVFAEPPPGARLCVVATNVAETSLTIPGIRYVVDCGRAKERKYNEDTGVQSFEVDWVSKASADQRSGRAGRTGPGHCYRLYSLAVYEQDFAQFLVPEILRMPVESVVLNMKSMGIDTIVNFPFPTPPDRKALDKAERVLGYLGAVEQKSRRITEVGRAMSKLPLSPRFAKMLVVGNQMECLPYVVAVVSALSVGDPFLNEHEAGVAMVAEQSEADEEDGSALDSDSPAKRVVRAAPLLEEQRQRRAAFHKTRAQFSQLDKHSDVLRLLCVVCAYNHVADDQRSAFVRSHFLRGKAMDEIVQLRQQVTLIVASGGVGSLKLPLPNVKQVAALKQMVAAGYVDQVALRGDLASPDVSISNRTPVHRIPYAPLFPATEDQDRTLDPFVYIHPNSLALLAGEMPPQYMVYLHLSLGASRDPERPARLRMVPLVDIGGKLLANVARSSGLVTYSKPLSHPYAPKMLLSTRRECWVVPRIGATIGSGGMGWDLPAVKVVQNKVDGKWTM